MSRLSCLTIAVMFRMCSSKSCLANRSPPPLFCILCRVETMSSLMRKACSTRAAVVFSWLRILSSSWSTRLADASGTAVNAWLCSGMFRTRLVEKNIQILWRSYTKVHNVFSLETVQCCLSSNTGEKQQSTHSGRAPCYKKVGAVFATVRILYRDKTGSLRKLTKV